MSDYLNRLRRVAYVTRLSGDRVVVDRAPSGERRRHVTDEHGNTVTEWAVTDRQDVTLRPPSLGLVIATSTDVRRELRREARRRPRRGSVRWLSSDVWRHVLAHDLVDVRWTPNRRGSRP